MALIQRHLCASHSQATPGGADDDLNKKRLQSVTEGTSKGRLAKLSTFQEDTRQPGRSRLLKKSSILSWIIDD